VGSRPGSLWENLAATYLRLRQFPAAREAYASALLLEPGSASLLEGLAKATAKERDPTRAKLLRNALVFNKLSAGGTGAFGLGGGGGGGGGGAAAACSVLGASDSAATASLS
jgi:hypothetical protein